MHILGLLLTCALITSPVKAEVQLIVLDPFQVFGLGDSLKPLDDAGITYSYYRGYVPDCAADINFIDNERVFYGSILVLSASPCLAESHSHLSRSNGADTWFVTTGSNPNSLDHVLSIAMDQVSENSAFNWLEESTGESFESLRSTGLSFCDGSPASLANPVDNRKIEVCPSSGDGFFSPETSFIPAFEGDTIDLTFTDLRELAMLTAVQVKSLLDTGTMDSNGQTSIEVNTRKGTFRLGSGLTTNR